MRLLFQTVSFLLAIGLQHSFAHDLWIETNTSIVRTGEIVRVDFKLGNCADGRRDFKTNGLVDRKGIMVEAISPTDRRVALLRELGNSSSDGQGGYWSSAIKFEEHGVNWITQSLDQTIVHDGLEMRGVVTSKAFVIAGDSPSDLRKSIANQVLEMPIELVLESSPFPSIEAGNAIRVQLICDGQPVPKAKVSFLPEGIDLDTEDEAQYERETDENGVAKFRPEVANHYLISARHIAKNNKSTGPKETYFSTSLTIRVSNRDHELAGLNITQK